MIGMDLDALRQQVDATLDPEWVTTYGDAAWHAALAIIGESPTATPEPKTSRRGRPLAVARITNLSNCRHYDFQSKNTVIR